VILLDTNVLSALMRRAPEPAVVDWLDRQPIETIWTTSISVFEIVMGIQLLEPSRRRAELEQAFEWLIDDDLNGRVQPFDRECSAEAGRIAAARQRSGRAVEFRDVQIAGIASARGATLATRNIRHFTGLGVDLIDPR